MACFSPLEATLKGGVVTIVGKVDTLKYQYMNGRDTFALPCGKCVGCRQVRVRSWALRCLHEAQMHESNCFVTLTYNDDYYYPSLVYRDFQMFMYRLRRRLGPTRFFMCGEYGDKDFRPHFHALLFGVNFADRSLVGKDLYRSAELEKLWKFGFSSVGDVNYLSAAYVARYSLKKFADRVSREGLPDVLDPVTGELVKLVPQFGHMSLNRGIGYAWFEKYWRDVFAARCGVVMPGGSTVPPPRYYMDLLAQLDGFLRDDKDFERYCNAQKFADDCTPARLRDREVCALAKEASRKERVL